MRYFSIFNKCVLAVLLAAAVGLLVPTTSFATGKVKVEAVGFFSHFPMKSTLDAIQRTCNGFGDELELTLYDETTDEGQKFLSKVGLSGHIPMALFVDGEMVHVVDGKNVTFRDFPGESWDADDLKKVIELRLEGVETAAKDQSPGFGQSDVPLPMQPNSQPGVGTNSQNTASGSNNVFLYGIFGILALLVVAVVTLFFSQRNYMRKRRS